MSDQAVEAAPLSDGDLELSADALEWIAGGYTANGNVRIRFGEDWLVAASAKGNIERIELTVGVWHRPGSVVSFDEATIDLRGRAGSLSGVRLLAGDVALSADAVQVAGNDLSAENGVLTPCACDDGKPAAVRFRAKHIDILDARVAVVRGGAVQVFQIPILPVPYWRVPLDPRAFRLAIPEIGYGDPGVSARWHATWGIEAYRFDAGPAWRQDRGGRLEAAVTGPIRARADVGWDDPTQSVRGAIVSDGGFSAHLLPQFRGSVSSALRERAAWDLTALSDANYAEDYAPAYVDRGVGYHESRVVGQASILRVEGWVPDTSPGGYPLLSAAVAPRFGGPLASLTPAVGAGMVLDEDEAKPLLFTSVQGQAGRTLGPLHVEASGGGQLAGVPDVEGDPSVSAAAQTRAELATWGDGPLGRYRLFPGIFARGGVDQVVSGSTSAAWAAGPSLRAETVLGPVVAAASAALLYDGATLTPEASLDLVGSTLSMRAIGSSSEQALQLRGGEAITGALGVLHLADEWFTWGEAGVHLGRFVSGASVSIDPDATASSAQIYRFPSSTVAVSGLGFSLGYDDGCSAFVLTGALSPDRALPDVGAQVVLRK